MVFLGAAPLTATLGKSPFWFAIYDLIAIRQEHRKRMNRLERELSDAAEEARQLAEESQKAKAVVVGST